MRGQHQPLVRLVYFRVHVHSPPPSRPSPFKFSFLHLFIHPSLFPPADYPCSTFTTVPSTWWGEGRGGERGGEEKGGGKWDSWFLNSWGQRGMYMLSLWSVGKSQVKCGKCIYACIRKYNGMLSALISPSSASISGSSTTKPHPQSLAPLSSTCTAHATVLQTL